MSHLYNADIQDAADNATSAQRSIRRTGATCPPAMRALSNSGGTFLGGAYHYDLVRPGIALYGGRAFEGAHRTRCSRSFACPRASCNCAPFQPARRSGMARAFKAQRPSRIATIACGYADGFLRALSGDNERVGPVGYIDEYPVPIVGRVSMDLITLDVTDVPEALVHRGGWVEVVGGRVTVDDLTDRAGTIGYELLSRLSRRVHRVYLEG